MKNEPMDEEFKVKKSSRKKERRANHDLMKSIRSYEDAEEIFEDSDDKYFDDNNT